MFFEGALDFDGDIAIDVGFTAEEVGEDGESFPVGVACFGEEFAGFVEIPFWCGWGLVASTCVWRDEAVCGGFSGAGDFRCDPFFIEGESEGLADFGVCEVWACDVEADEVVAEEGAGVEVGAFAEFVDEGGWGEAFVHHEIDLACGVEVEGGGWARGWEDVDGLEGDGLCVPVAGIFFESDAIEEAPFFEEEGAVADEVSGLSGPIGMGFDGWPMDGEVGGKGAEVEEVGGWIFESDLEGEGVGGGDAESGCVVDLAFVEGFRVLDGVELGGVFATGFGAESAGPCVAEIL